MTFINKKLPLNSAKENREIRKSPYSFAIVELQEIVSLMDTERGKIIKDIVILTSTSNSYTVTVANYIIAVAQVAGTITIPSASAGADDILYDGINIKNTVDSSQNITINSTFGTIEGASTITLTPGDSVTLFPDGVNWHII